jgi:hypothetical protein
MRPFLFPLVTKLHITDHQLITLDTLKHKVEHPRPTAGEYLQNKIPLSTISVPHITYLTPLFPIFMLR